MSIGIIHKFPSAATACQSRSRALALSPSPSLSFYACLFHCVCAELNEFRERADDGTMRSHRTRHSRITAKGERRNETNEIMKRTLRRRRRLAARWGEVKWSETPTKEIIKGRAQKGDAKTWQFLAWQHTTTLKAAIIIININMVIIAMIAHVRRVFAPSYIPHSPFRLLCFLPHRATATIAIVHTA